MNIIINNSSFQPIYEQIVEQIKDSIVKGRLKENDMLPSVRSLSKEIRVSALTVKKAYDELEQEGFIITVHGKGSFVTSANQELMLEEQRREAEQLMDQAIRKGKSCGMSRSELEEMYQLVLEDMI